MKRFEQLKSLYNNMLASYSEHQNSTMYIAAITSEFDRLFELSWKVLKDYLDNELGVYEAKTGSPKAIIKLAYKYNLINDEEFWINLLKDRNDDTHHYSETQARAYAARIEHIYLPAYDHFVQDLCKLIPEEPGIILKIPDSLLEAAELSGLGYDEFMRKIKRENLLTDDLEVIKNWHSLETKYNFNNRMSVFDENKDIVH